VIDRAVGRPKCRVAPGNGGCGGSPFSAVTVTEGTWISVRGKDLRMGNASYARRPMHRDLRMHNRAALTILRASDGKTTLSSRQYIATADVTAVRNCVVDVFIHVRAPRTSTAYEHCVRALRTSTRAPEHHVRAPRKSFRETAPPDRQRPVADGP
jgi:hypothetical protein